MNLSGKLEIQCLSGDFLIKDAGTYIAGKITTKEEQGELGWSRYIEKISRELINWRIPDQQRYQKVQLCRHSGIREGQPYIKAFTGIDERVYNISISHCKDFVSVCTVNSGLPGIDIQNVRSVDRSVVERLFSKSDIDSIEKICAYDGNFHWNKAFAVLWTIKESCLKALGIGLKLGFNSVIVKDIDFSRNYIELFLDNKLIEAVCNMPDNIFVHISFESEFIITLTVFM